MEEALSQTEIRTRKPLAVMHQCYTENMLLDNYNMLINMTVGYIFNIFDHHTQIISLTFRSSCWTDEPLDDDYCL